jgi:glycosyltransferase involved in cell wall biosynthesis
MRSEYELICLSHQRWDFAYHRTQPLMRRCARERRVFFIEQPVYGDGPPRLDVAERDGVRVCVPTLPPDVSPAGAERLQSAMLGELVRVANVRAPVAWYTAPAALAFTEALRPVATVYDCSGELAPGSGAPPPLAAFERELWRRADLVFTASASLHEATRARHPGVHAFPNAVEAEHFAKARTRQADPDDQAPFPRPRLGFFGDLDGRVDVGLLAAVARARPAWQLLLLGPATAAARASLPRLPNLRHLGPKGHFELPRYLANWDVALLPFGKHDATRFLGPSKALECLAAGLPVVATPVRDLTRPLGAEGLVHLADGVEAFVAACEAALAEVDRGGRLVKADAALARVSWPRTWDAMARLIDAAVASRLGPSEDAPALTLTATGAA